MFNPSFFVAFLILILVACETASAEWMRVGGTHKYEAYAAPSTIGVTDQKATIMWTMKNYDEELYGGPAHTSGDVPFREVQKQFDCLGSRSRPLLSKYYAEPMGRGASRAGGKRSAEMVPRDTRK